MGSLYFHYGFLDEARQELDASLSLDPRDGCEELTRCMGFSRPRVGRVFWYRQQFDSALAIYARLPSIRGSFLWEKAIVLNALGRSTEALALLDSLHPPGTRENDDHRAARALVYATLGRPRDALAHLTAITARPGGGSHYHHAQFTIACAFARLGRKADAVEWLRRTAENGMPNYPLFRNDPNLKSLQGDPAYEALMTRLQQQHQAYARLVRGP